MPTQVHLQSPSKLLRDDHLCKEDHRQAQQEGLSTLKFRIHSRQRQAWTIKVLRQLTRKDKQQVQMELAADSKELIRTVRRDVNLNQRQMRHYLALCRKWILMQPGLDNLSDMELTQWISLPRPPSHKWLLTKEKVDPNSSVQRPCWLLKTSRCSSRVVSNLALWFSLLPSLVSTTMQRVQVRCH